LASPRRDSRNDQNAEADRLRFARGHSPTDKFVCSKETNALSVSRHMSGRVQKLARVIQWKKPFSKEKAPITVRIRHISRNFLRRLRRNPQTGTTSSTPRRSCYLATHSSSSPIPHSASSSAICSQSEQMLPTRKVWQLVTVPHINDFDAPRVLATEASEDSRPCESQDPMELGRHAEHRNKILPWDRRLMPSSMCEPRCPVSFS
jgi:hypothetical protein